MPKFFFDLKDEDGIHRDDVGVELPDIDAAKAEARRALLEMSRDNLELGADRDGHLEMLIRDHGVGPVRLSITLREL
jgi:uncharacterized protein DUF6894